jgi:hypothetical protein
MTILNISSFAKVLDSEVFHTDTMNSFLFS